MIGINYKKWITVLIIIIFNIKLSIVKGQTISVCQGDTISLKAGSFRGNIQWQETSDSLTWNDIAGAIYQPYKIKVVTSKYYRAKVTEGTCRPVYSDIKKVNIGLEATATSNGPICAGSQLILTGGPDGMTDYSWTGPNSFKSNEQSPIVSTNATTIMSGTYTLKVTGTGGCNGTISIAVLVTDKPQPPTIGTITSTSYSIKWNWKPVNGAISYYYNTVNDIGTATNNGNYTFYNQTDLKCNTPYTLYVWAVISGCTSDAGVLKFNTTCCVSPNCGTIVDSRDGQTYSTIMFGNECWMAQNLNYGRFIKTDSGQTSGHIKYCYNNDINNCEIYGGLYEWPNLTDFADHPGCDGTGESQPACTNPIQGLCPSGWHIPSQMEWTYLERHLGSCPEDFPYDDTTRGAFGCDEGDKILPNGCSGFSALLAGRGHKPSFSLMGEAATFWASFEYLQLPQGWYGWGRYVWPSAMPHQIYRNASSEGVGGYMGGFAYSVRCVKDG
jgi:uncharacterized protein (TIGR02145 family)